VRESRSHGSVRGALSNGRPYRESLTYPALAIAQTEVLSAKPPRWSWPFPVGLVRGRPRAYLQRLRKCLT
jgi:hypothetical protein